MKLRGREGMASKRWPRKWKKQDGVAAAQNQKSREFAKGLGRSRALRALARP